MAQRGFITVAFGKPLYRAMAHHLLLSYRRFAPGAPFAVITDLPDDPQMRAFDVRIPVNPEFGGGVAQKLHLDRYSPFEETLFIDSDCLFYKNPEELWGHFAPYDDFGVKGFRYLGPGEMSPYHETIARNSGVDRWVNVNSGVLYFRKAPRAAAMFDRSREIYRDRERIGLRQFKTSPVSNDTVFGLALVSCGVEFLPWDGGRVQELTYEMEPGEAIDIRIPNAEFSIHGRDVDPIVIHFNGGGQDSRIYLRECARIRMRGSALAALADPLGYVDWLRQIAFVRVWRRLSREARALPGRLGMAAGR